jgi:hypothetical protein
MMLALASAFMPPANLPVLRLDHQSVFFELRGAPRPYQEINVGTTLKELPAEIAAERSGAENQYLHVAPKGEPCSPHIVVTDLPRMPRRANTHASLATFPNFSAEFLVRGFEPER